MLEPVAVLAELPEDDPEVEVAAEAVPVEVVVAVVEPVPFTLLASVATATPVLASAELEEPLTRVVATVEVAVPVEAEEAVAVEAEELEEDDEPSVMLNWPCFPYCQQIPIRNPLT